MKYIRIHVLKDNLKLGLYKNSIVSVLESIGKKAIDGGYAVEYINKEVEILEEKESKKGKK